MFYSLNNFFTTLLIGNVDAQRIDASNAKKQSTKHALTAEQFDQKGERVPRVTSGALFLQEVSAPLYKLDCIEYFFLTRSFRLEPLCGE